MLKVGILTHSIRNDWSDPDTVKDRIDEIVRLLSIEGREDLINELEGRDEDGRWFRDEWSGPYGYDLLTPDIYKNVRDVFKICNDIVYQDFYHNYRSLKLLYTGIVAKQVTEGRDPNDLATLIGYKTKDPVEKWTYIGGKLLPMSYITLDEFKRIEKKPYFIGF